MANKYVCNLAVGMVIMDGKGDGENEPGRAYSWLVGSGL
jgi:hypothetical protein